MTEQQFAQEARDLFKALKALAYRHKISASLSAHRAFLYSALSSVMDTALEQGYSCADFARWINVSRERARQMRDQFRHRSRQGWVGHEILIKATCSRTAP